MAAKSERRALPRRAWARALKAGERAVVEGAVELALMEPIPGMPAPTAAVERAFAMGLPAALPWLAPLAFAPNAEVAATAEAGVVRLLASMRSWEHLALDRGLRHADSKLGGLLTPSDLPRLVRGSANQGVLLGLAACHPSGAVRATAMHTADQWEVEIPLCLTLVRLDDWVRSVRHLARKRVLDRLELRHTPELVTALPLMEYLARRRRVQRDKALRWVEQLLRDEQARSALWEGLNSDETAVRRSAIAILAECPPVDLVRMLDVACTSADPVAGLRAAEAVMANLDGVPEALLRAPNARVRGSALDHMAGAATTDSLAALHAGMMDPRRGVRSVALAHLKKGGATGLSARYRGLVELGEGPLLKTALHGMGEVGALLDVDILLPFLSPNQPPGVARAALESIARLDPGGRVGLLTRHLDDPRRGVSRAAANALVSPRCAPVPEDLWAVVLAARHAHGSRNAFRVLARAPRWIRVTWLLRGADSTDPWIAAHARRRLDAWTSDPMRHATRPPSLTEATAVEETLADRGAGVPENTATTVRDVLAAARTSEPGSA